MNCTAVITTFPETIKEKFHGGKIRVGQAVNNVVNGFKSDRLRVVLISSFLFSAGFTFFTTFFGVYLRNKFSFSSSKIGDYFAIVGLCIALSQGLVVGRVAKKLVDFKVLKFSMFGTGAMMLIYFLTPTTSSMYLYMVIPFFAIFNGLCMANTSSLISRSAEMGKQVAVVLELKARFDEARNVSWAKELEYAGVHVTYGIVGLKTHSKCVLVVRNDPDKMRRYVHIGTGNYNSTTARLYEDIGFFTSEDAIGSDVAELFNFLTGYAQEPDYAVLLVAPHQLRDRIVALIDKEATFGEAGKITIKINSISDPAVIEALYRASGAGVKINLIVRGICCIRAGVEGMSENIVVRSILGRYLEHSRIYRFEHGLDDNEPLHLIGSADMMGRNLDGRVEALAPLTHPKHRMWLDTVLGFLLDDASTHFLLQSDNRWERIGSVAQSGDAQKKLHEWVVATQVR